MPEPAANTPTSNAGPSRPHEFWAQVAAQCAAVAVAFVVGTLVLLGWDYGRRLASDPLESPEYRALKAELARNPAAESVKEQIRALDLALRREFFRQRTFTARGAWLLLGGIVVFVVAAKTAATLQRRLPMPQPETVPHDRDQAVSRAARWAVGGLAAGLFAMAVLLSTRLTSEFDRSEAVVFSKEGSAPQVARAPANDASPSPAPLAKANAGTSRAASPVPTLPQASQSSQQGPNDDEYRKSWPRFRGPGGNGISAYTNVPMKWDAASGENILWKTPVPLEGNNSAIVWKDRVFVTGATPEKRQVFCFDAGDGKLRWTRDVPGTPDSAAEIELNEDTGFAAPTAATDGRRVFAIFANGDLGAFDFDGNLVWARSLGIPKNHYGHASSLATWRDRLIVQFDQGTAKEGKSRLLALDGATGKTVWETPRPVPNSWSTPLVINVKGQEQIVACGDPWVIAYRASDGQEVWRGKFLRQDVGPSPTYLDGIVYVASEFPQVSAIRADGQGDITATHLAWMGEDGLPDTCSPLATPEYLILLTSAGTMTCYGAKDGKKLWEHDFEVNFKSSPSLVGKSVYVISDEGKGFVVEPGPTGVKIAAESNLGEPCVASPAFQDGRIYLRGKKHLFCIGAKL
jgi:outer membrane protein assembly factor BamB